MNLSSKHLKVVKVLIDGNQDGTYVDLDQLIERLDYETTKQALQHQLRTLIRKGVIQKIGTEKRRDRRRRLLSLTPAAQQVLVRKR